MPELEKYEDDKTTWLSEFEALRPDLHLPVGWDQDKKAKVMDAIRPKKTRISLFTAIPLICKGSKCTFAAICPLLAQNIAPVGYSCHPAGTLIYTYRHGQIPIQELDPSIHTLYGFERKYSAIRSGQGGFKFAVSSRDYCGFMVAVSTDQESYQATHDHICVARFNENAIGKFCVYLMRKGDFWRIGKSTLARQYKQSNNGHKTFLGFPLRGNMEEADSMWILGVYDTNTEALLAEEYYSLKTQTTKVCFADSLKKYNSKSDGLYRWATKEQLLDHHKSLLKDEQFYRDFLFEMGLSIDYPIWSKDKQQGNPETGLYVKWPMFIRACNIIPGVMDVPVISEENKKHQMGKKSIRVADWKPVSIFKERYCGKVYSLDVETHKTYFAGGIATHNCPLELAMIQQFMNEYMEELQVNPENLVEVAIVRDLVNLEIQSLRATKVLSLEHFIQENVIGIDNDGRPIFKKELHLAVELEDRLHKRKKDTRNQLLATRESRARAGQAHSDPAQTIAKMLGDISSIQRSKERELRQLTGLDDYEEAEIVPPEEEYILPGEE